MGKDIRINNIGDWLCSLLAKLARKQAKIYEFMLGKTLKLSLMQGLAILFRESLTFAILIYLTIIGNISMANFIFALGVLVVFSTWITGLSQQISDIQYTCKECGVFRDFIYSPKKQSMEVDLEIPTIIEDIEFKDVAFSYDVNNTEILKNINFKMSKGEKIAIVGENGAGKTTLIKLLCGFYIPTSGQILLNGVDINLYNAESRYKLFSAVFQDFNFLPMTILENITLNTAESSDIEKANNILEKVALLKKIKSFDNGVNALMVREVWKDAVVFSGGEQQRLLLARALYKNAPILILDEPTASLDPIAENEIYQQYNTLVENKLSIFISHRLSSTRFCSKILYLSKGEIVERGSHDELIEMKGGYYKMYQTQSYYYRKMDDIKGVNNEK